VLREVPSVLLLPSPRRAIPQAHHRFDDGRGLPEPAHPAGHLLRRHDRISVSRRGLARSVHGQLRARGCGPSAPRRDRGRRRVGLVRRDGGRDGLGSDPSSLVRDGSHPTHRLSLFLARSPTRPVLVRPQTGGDAVGDVSGPGDRSAAGRLPGPDRPRRARQALPESAFPDTLGCAKGSRASRSRSSTHHVFAHPPAGRMVPP